MKTYRVLSGRRYQGGGTRAQNKEARTYDNIVFDSLLEMVQYRDKLKPLLNRKVIRALQYHPIFVFKIPDLITGEVIEVGQYESDFSWIECATEKLHVADVKAWERDNKGNARYITSESYIWQKPLMKVCFGIDVIEL